VSSSKLDLTVLPQAQLNIWPKLNRIDPCFTLYGGTAIALQLGHRISIDFDFFSNRSFQSDEILSHLSSTFLVKEVFQTGSNLLTCSIESNDMPVLFSFFGNLGIGSLQKPLLQDSNNLKIASLEDLFVMKLKAILGRVEEKDFIDIAALLRSKLSLEKALSGFEVIFPSQASPSILLRTLSYLGYERLKNLSSQDIKRIQDAVNIKDIPEVKLYQSSISS
jgi:hypothetical protein